MWFKILIWQYLIFCFRVGEYKLTAIIIFGTLPFSAKTDNLLTVSSFPTISSNLAGLYFSTLQKLYYIIYWDTINYSYSYQGRLVLTGGCGLDVEVEGPAPKSKESTSMDSAIDNNIYKKLLI